MASDMGVLGTVQKVIEWVKANPVKTAVGVAVVVAFILGAVVC